MADTEGTPDFHLAAYVTNLGKYNEGYLVGEWVKFPVTLADKLDEMSDAEVQHFKAIVKMGEHSDSVQDLINLTENLDCYEIYPDITDEYDL